MGFQKGKLKLTVYEIKINPYENKFDLLDAAKRNAAMPIAKAMTMPEGKSVGFASSKVLLDEEISENNSFIEGYVTLNVRQTAKKINAGMLKAIIQREEDAYMKANLRDFVPRKMRNEIKENAVDFMMQGAPLAIKGTEIVFDGERLLIGATSKNECDTVCEFLIKNLGIVMEWKEHTDATGDSFRAGRKFLTWIFDCVKQGFTLTGFLKMMIGGPLELLAGDCDDENGYCCTKAKLEGETVVNSIEMDTMISANKNIRKAKLTLVKGNDVWKFTFDADTWSFSELGLPKNCETFADRMDAIRELYDEMDRLFNAWKIIQADELNSAELPDVEKK